MSDRMNADGPSTKKYTFKSLSDDSKKYILNEKDKKNTQKATQSAITQFQAYLGVKQLPNINDLALDLDLLGETLLNFYEEICPKNVENYAVQTLKCK